MLLRKISSKIYQYRRLTLLTFLVTFSNFLPSAGVINSSENKVNQERQYLVQNSAADRFYQQGVQQDENGQLRDAIQSFQQALNIYQQQKDQKGEAKALGRIGLAYYALQDYDNAIKYLQPFLTISRELKQPRAEGVALTNLGSSYVFLKKYAKAVEYYRPSLTIVREFRDVRGEGTILSGLGVAYDNLGEYPKAIESYKKLLQVAQELGDSDMKGLAELRLGNTYVHLGDYQQALDFYQQTLRTGQAIKKRQLEGRARGGLGNVAFSQGNYQKAIEYYQQSLLIAQETKDSEGEGNALGNLGNTYYVNGNYQKALEAQQRSLAIAKSNKDKQAESEALSGLGLAYEELGKYDQAIASYQQRLAIARSTGNQLDMGIALNNLGGAYLETNKLAAAEKSLRSAIEIWESLRKELADTNKISIFENQVVTYGVLQKVLILNNQPNAALEIAESGRARAFVALLASQISPQTPNIVSPSITEIQKIARNKNVTLVEYSIIYDDPVSTNPLLRASDLFIWVVKPTGEIAFRKVDLKHISLLDLVTKNLESVATGVNRGNANQLTFAPGDLIKLKDDEDDYPAWMVIAVNPHNGWLILRLTTGNNNQSPIERPPSDVKQKVESAHATNLRLQQLHQLLIEPIADLLPTEAKAQVIFIPHRELFKVPFSALQDKQRKYLIEKHTLLTAPAIQVLDLTQKQRQRITGTGKKALVVGNPIPNLIGSLPAAEQEAENIARLLNTQAIIGTKATKSAIVPQLSQARLIHLAAHGILDDFQGLGSAIALAPSGNNDNGLLTAEDILKLRLNAELVVLSACNTGKGRITGDGVIGLSRSLISAGTPSVIVSLWAVSDHHTADLMTEFYQNLQRHVDRATALRQAMLTTMKQHPNPQYWAAFTLIGETE